MENEYFVCEVPYTHNTTCSRSNMAVVDDEKLSDHIHYLSLPFGKQNIHPYDNTIYEY